MSSRFWAASVRVRPKGFRAVAGSISLLVEDGFVVEQPMLRKLTTSASKNAVRIIIGNEDLKDIGKLSGINKGA
jgi:hypothetical protein